MLAATSPRIAGALELRWQPARPAVGDAVWVEVRGVAPGAAVEASVAGRVVPLFPSPGGYSGLAGLDVDDAPGARPWTVTVRSTGETTQGTLDVAPRQFFVQHLTLPSTMVDLDPRTEQRANAEAEQLGRLYASVTPERLWRGAFVRPVQGDEPGTGFGARRVINGQPRAPHTGTDYAAPKGTPVLASNDGRVALVADFFFPGRLVVLDHGLGVYTMYFHLDQIGVTAGERVTRGQPIGTIGATGRATGPHLHFGVHAGGARLDPATLLALPLPD